jgi:hypothetical protein
MPTSSPYAGRPRPPRPHWFEPTDPPMIHEAFPAWPLQTDSFCFLCPECGGYGAVGGSSEPCATCAGKGELALDCDQIRAARAGEALL